MKFEEEIKELIAKRNRWIESSKENNFDEGIFKLLTELYPDEAHFIYEMLQNAEDAGKRKGIESNTVIFDLHMDKLTFTHQGESFSLADIDSITGISQSTKKEDTVSIGKFGIGFKSVFAYTDTPIISDYNVAFEIENLVVPKQRFDKYKADTQGVYFEIPFNHSKHSINPTVKSPEKCYQQIEQFLQNFTGQELLFLRNITKIIVKYDGQEFEYTKKYDEKSCIATITKTDMGTNDVINAEKWVTFYKPLPEHKDLYTSFAFKLENDKIVPITGKLFVYFPADKETTNLNFHIHAPFTPTVARDSIPYADPQNIKTRDALTEHFKDVILQLHKLEYLNDIKDFDIFPCVESHLSDFYKPLYTALVDTIKSNPILPARNTGFISIENAIRVMDSKFKDLFSSEQARTLLFGENKDYCRESNLRNNPVDKLLNEIIEPRNNIISLLNSKLDQDADFIKQQPNDWIVALYQYLDSKKWYGVGYILKDKDGVFHKYIGENPVLNETTFCPDLYKLCKIEMGEDYKPILKKLGVGELTREEKLDILYNEHKNLCGKSLTDVYHADTEDESLKSYKKHFDKLYKGDMVNDICLLSADNIFYPAEDLFVKRLERFNINKRHCVERLPYGGTAKGERNIYVLHDIYDDYYDKLNVIKNIEPRLFSIYGGGDRSQNPATSEAPKGNVTANAHGENHHFNVVIDHIFDSYNIDLELSVGLYTELAKSQWDKSLKSKFRYNSSRDYGENDSTVKIQLNKKWLFDKNENLVAPEDIFEDELHDDYKLLIHENNLNCILDFKLRHEETKSDFMTELENGYSLEQLKEMEKDYQAKQQELDFDLPPHTQTGEETTDTLGKKPLSRNITIYSPRKTGYSRGSVTPTTKHKELSEKRKEISEQAINNAILYYEDMEECIDIEDVRDEPCAWDLTIEMDDGNEYYVEVKGRGIDAYMELADSQYETMQSNKSKYRFYINTLSGYAEFIYNPETAQYESTETDHILKIESVESYILTIE